MRGLRIAFGLLLAASVGVLAVVAGLCAVPRPSRFSQVRTAACQSRIGWFPTFHPFEA